MATVDKRWLEAGFGALAGMRSMLAPAFVGADLSRGTGNRRTQPAGLLGSAAVRRVFGLLAASEMVADKLPVTPDRIAPKVLFGRIVTGALAASGVASSRKQSRWTAALLGAGAAVASTYATFYLRRFLSQRLKVPNVAAGLLEDGLAVGLGTWLVASDRR